MHSFPLVKKIIAIYILRVSPVDPVLSRRSFLSHAVETRFAGTDSGEHAR